MKGALGSVFGVGEGVRRNDVVLPIWVATGRAITISDLVVSGKRNAHYNSRPSVDLPRLSVALRVEGAGYAPLTSQTQPQTQTQHA